MNNINKKKCELCGREISLSNYKRHIEKCNGTKSKSKNDLPNIEIKEEWLNINNNKYACPYCNKEYSKMGIKNHIYLKHFNINYNENLGGWNKGLTKEMDERVKLNGEKISKSLLNNKNFKGNIPWNKGLTNEIDERVRKSSQKRSENYNNNSNKIYINNSHRGLYKGYWCDSSWELAFVIYNLENNIKFIRNTQGFKYIFNNIEHKYYPDFIMEDGTYIEIKGYETEKDIAKQNDFPYKLKVLYNKDIKPYIDYVIAKYGKDYINLYENKPLKNKLTKDEKRLKLIEKKKTTIYADDIQKIINSDIDFSKFGWVSKVSLLINKPPQKVSQWMKIYMTEFYNEKCFKRKK